MTREQAIEEYTKKFGGFPYFLFMGASDEYLIKKVKIAVKQGIKIRPEKDLDY